MFRRKDETDADMTENNPNATNAPQGSLLNSADSTASAAPVQPYSGASSSSSASPAAPAYGAGAAYGAPSASRPAGDSASRPASPFRAAGAPAGEIPRARMPDGKGGQPGAFPGANAATSNKDSRRVLTVGSDILLKGEIATCDRLVIEGKVDATLNDVHTVEIAEAGSFKGTAQIEYAEISGLFEGELVVKNRLIIYATGKVRGKITYGEIEIERGGELTGEIKSSTSEAQSYLRRDKAAA